MSAGEWSRITELFEQALDRAPAERDGSTGLRVTPKTVLKVWDPAARFVNETGLVHGAHAAPSRLHSNVAPAAPDPVRVSVAVVEAVVPEGAPLTDGGAGDTISDAVALTLTAAGASVALPPYSTK